MKISIVMPIYNADPYLRESINSVIEQTSSDWELILVDDGSTDNSSQICDEYGNNYERVITVHRSNGGQYEARKTGISMASGEYIGFLDADDTLSKDYVSVLNKFVEENNFPEIVCFGINEKVRDVIKKREVNNKRNYLLTKAMDQNDFLALLYEGKITGSLCSKIISNKLINSIKIESDDVKKKRYGEDWYQFLSTIMSAKTVCLLNMCLYNYIRNDNGTSLGFEKRDFDYFSTKYADQLLLDLALKWGNSKTNIDRIIAKNFNESVYYMLKYFRSAKGLKRKLDCIKYDWSTYLLETDLNILKDNTFVRESYKEVYDTFVRKLYIKIFVKEIIGW